MEHRTLEINSLSGKDLNKVNLITKMAVYAVVSISGRDKKLKQTTKTPVDRDGDTNPAWNSPIKFIVDEAAVSQNLLTLDFKLVCERALGDKDIGEVHVPINDLLESPAAVGNYGHQQRFVSYQVRKPNGQPKGQITFLCKFTGTETEAAAPPVPVPGAAELYEEPVTAYPVVGPSFEYSPPSPGVYPHPVDQATELYPPLQSSGGYPHTVDQATELYPPLQSSGGYPHPVDQATEMYPPLQSSGGYPHPVDQATELYPPLQSSGGYPTPPPGYGYPPPLSYGVYPPPPPPEYGYPPHSGTEWTGDHQRPGGYIGVEHKCHSSNWG